MRRTASLFSAALIGLVVFFASLAHGAEAKATWQVESETTLGAANRH